MFRKQMFPCLRPPETLVVEAKMFLNLFRNTASSANVFSFARQAGLKVSDQMVAHATKFLVVRPKNHVWSHSRALKAQVQCD